MVSFAPSLYPRYPDQLEPGHGAVAADRLHDHALARAADKRSAELVTLSAAEWVADDAAASGFVVVDREGLAVACTVSTNGLFGAGRMASGTGIVLAAAIGVLFLLAYASATHDVACDGLYMGALDAKQQATFAGLLVK